MGTVALVGEVGWIYTAFAGTAVEEEGGAAVGARNRAAVVDRKARGAGRGGRMPPHRPEVGCRPARARTASMVAGLRGREGGVGRRQYGRRSR